MKFKYFGLIIFLINALIVNGQSIQDCDEDLDCFIQAAQNCTPAKVTFRTNNFLFYNQETAIHYLEIKKDSRGNCLFFQKTEGVEYASQFYQKLSRANKES